MQLKVGIILPLGGHGGTGRPFETCSQTDNCCLSLCSVLCDYMLSVVPLLKLCCEEKNKSDLDMAQLAEHMSNPVSKCIPTCMCIKLLAEADCSMISRDVPQSKTSPTSMSGKHKNCC